MILYIGNKMTRHGKTPTGVEVLGGLLSQFMEVHTVSDKEVPWRRCVEMVNTLLKYRRRITCVLIDTYGTRNFYYGVMAATLSKWCQLPYIPILRGGSLPKRLDRSPFLARYMFAGSRVNVAPSKYNKTALAQHGYTNCVVIPNTIDLAQYSFLRRQSVSPPALLWVRSFDRIYNCTMAPEVLSYLKRDYPDARLCMVGPDKDGSLRHTLDKAHALGLSVGHTPEDNADILITGKLERPAWHALSSSYNVFINTTRVDNTPVSVVEAMALGLPVVSTRVGGMPYLIEDNVDGVLVDSDNALMMARQISQLVAHPDKAQALAVKARQKVEQYDWRVVKQQWQSLLTSI